MVEQYRGREDLERDQDQTVQESLETLMQNIAPKVRKDIEGDIDPSFTVRVKKQ